MEIKAIITEYTANKKTESTKKHYYRTEADINNFKASIKNDILHRQSISNNIRKTDYFFICNIKGMWQMQDKTSVFNKGFKLPTRKTASLEKNIIDKTTIELNGKLKSLKITAAVSRGWFNFIDSKPMTPKEVQLVKSILSMPSKVVSAKQYMVLQDIKSKVNRRRPVS